MQMIGRLFFILLPFSLHSQPYSSSGQHRIDQLREGLMHRMKVSLFPPVQFDASLEANSRFARNTIWLGRVQPDFHTEDDTLSLLYHEYHHFLLQDSFPVGLDSAGVPLQWVTDIFFLYTPCPEEIERDLQSISQSLDSIAYAALKHTLEKPRSQLFRYAPSNLSREEIAAYRAQLTGGRIGLYTLSYEARRAIQIRLYQLEGSTIRRQVYEKENGLGADGLPLP